MNWLLFVLALAIACKRSEPEAPVPPRDVHCIAAMSESTSDKVTLRGSIVARPDKDSVVAAEVAGRIRSIVVREGDHVARGALIASIECGIQTDAQRQARAALDSANATVVEARAARDREAHLVDRGIAAVQALEAATAREAAAKAAADTASARLDDAYLFSARCSVRASLDGIVIRILRRQGDIVDGTSATAIAEVADPTSAEIVVTAGATELARIVVGQTAAIAIASQKPNFTGIVVAAPPAVDRVSGLGSVRLTLAGDAKPLLGALVIAEIDLGNVHPVVTVPRAAVRSAGGDRSEVVICAGTEAHVRAVKAGAVLGDRIVIDGVDAGDHVAADGALGIGEGDAIHEASP
ncbi:hypothetical protein BH09MYX1_BH09MYX1_57340 [soil metagenome]